MLLSRDKKTLRMQTNSLTEVNPLNLTDDSKQALVSVVCAVVVDRRDSTSSAAVGSALGCSALLMPFTQVLLFCSYNLNFDPNFKNLIIDAFTVYYLWRFVACLHPVSAFMFCSDFMFFYWWINVGVTCSRYLILWSLFSIVEAT